MNIYVSAKLIDLISESKLNLRRIEINNNYEKTVSKKYKQKNEKIWNHWMKLMKNQNSRKIDSFLNEMSWFKELEVGFTDDNPKPIDNDIIENEKENSSSSEDENIESESNEDEDEDEDKDSEENNDESENDEGDKNSSSDEKKK